VIVIPPMHIAVFSYGLPVPGQKRGGIERVADMLAQGLAERGHHVAVLSHDSKPAGAAYEVHALPWKRFVNTWLGRRVTMGYLGNVMALVPDYRPFDVVISFGDSLLLPLANKPVLRVMLGSALGEAKSAHSTGRRVLQLGIYLQELATAMLQRTAGISENTRRDNPFVRHTIPLGIDPAIFSPIPAEKTEVPSLIFVGTARGRKRGRFLLDIFENAIRPAHPDAALMFVGPADRPQAGVTYHTGVADQELACMYRRAWLYVSPSTYEGFGLPYLEAMACGTAVVATPNPGSREVLADGDYGKLAEDAAFGTAILELLNDEVGRRAIEAAGLRRARQLSSAAMIDQYEAVLHEMCAHERRIASA
jgi:phosphatidyl-myo-inositol alpha-mannosyltransferase